MKVTVNVLAHYIYANNTKVDALEAVKMAEQRYDNIVDRDTAEVDNEKLDEFFKSLKNIA